MIYLTGDETTIVPTGNWQFISKQITVSSSIQDKRSAINSVTTLTDDDNPENNNYVSYNYELNVWTVGNMGRSCWLDSFGARDNPFAFELLETINLIDIGHKLFFENLISDFRLLPVPEINTAVLILR